MCMHEILEWVRHNVSAADIHNCDVLEIGSYNVNGSLREVIMPFMPASYTGIDMRSGPGVDVVCRAEDLVRQFGPHRFDVVLSSCTFEHIRHWRAALAAMKQVCRPGGLLLFIVPSHFPYHAYPYDYWRYRPADVAAIFADCQIECLEEERHPYATVYARVRKPVSFVACDLAHYRLYSVIVEQPIVTLHVYHYFSPTFLHVLWRDVGRQRLARLWLVMRMGVRIRVLEPLHRWLA